MLTMDTKLLIQRLLALVLVVALGLAGCTDAGTGLVGDYRQDTLTVVENLTTAIDLPDDDPAQPEIREQARKQINDYVSRYRRDSSIAGLRSFTTMQTALNALAGYYSSAYSTRPLPEKLKKRLHQEFAQVERVIQRGG